MVHLHAIVVPASRSEAGPLRRTREIVPWVVGVHLRVTVLPALRVLPFTGYVKAFCADVRVARAVMAVVRKVPRRILRDS